MIVKIIQITLRTATAYIILLILGRVIGRKLISRITYFDFIVGVIIGSTAVRMVLGPQESPLLAGVAVVVITILVVITDFFDIKSLYFRKLVDGEPIILISNGKFLDYNLKKAKININKLMMDLREKNIFNVEDVAIAVIESDGELSVLPKVNKQPVTTGDLNISKTYNGMTTDIIIDGEIIHDNLKLFNHDEKWLRDQLKKHNIDSVGNVFYAGISEAGTLYISTKTKT